MARGQIPTIALYKKAPRKDTTCFRTIDAKWVEALALSHPYMQRARG